MSEYCLCGHCLSTVRMWITPGKCPTHPENVRGSPENVRISVNNETEKQKSRNRERENSTSASCSHSAKRPAAGHPAARGSPDEPAPLLGISTARKRARSRLTARSQNTRHATAPDCPMLSAGYGVGRKRPSPTGPAPTASPPASRRPATWGDDTHLVSKAERFSRKRCADDLEETRPLECIGRMDGHRECSKDCISGQ